ncbi:TPA: transcription antitermination factor NusB [bacterium]|nr:transcription antitermination factor NusB [bacterium]
MRERSDAREACLEILYWLKINKDRFSKKAIDKYFSLYPEKESDFAKSLVLGVCKNKGKIDRIIKKYLQNWDIERLAVIDYIILHIAIFEIIFSKDAPPVVVIDEAIELSKKFSTSDSYRIINGILDKIIKVEVS